MGVAIRTVTMHGRRMSLREYCPDRPTGDDVVVLLHGIAGSGQTWDPVLAELDRHGFGRAVLAPDLHGHGDSAAASGDYSLGAHAASLRDLLVGLGHPRATLVGHSFGGGVVLQFAYQFPQHCGRLGLVASGGLGTAVSPLLRAAALPGVEWMLPLLTDRRVVGPVDWLAEQLGLGRIPRVRATLDHVGSLADTGRRSAFLHTLRGVVGLGGQRIDSTDRLYLANTKQPVPLLIAWGDRDTIIPVAHAHRANSLVPHSRLEIFSGAGHFPHYEQPVRFAAVLTSFLDRSAPACLDVHELAEHIVERDVFDQP